MAVKTNDKRASLRRGTKRSYDHKDDGGGSGILKVPSGVSFVKWEKEKKYRHLIVAFKAGKNHPLVKSGDFKEGEYVASVEFHVHKGLGVDGKKSVLCMKSTYGKKCAICDHENQLRKDGKNDLADNLKPKKQVAYIIYDVKAGKKEFQVISAPHFCFEKGLVEAARTASDDDEGFVDYPYIDGEGAVVKYMIKESSFKNRSFLTLADGTSFKTISKDDDLPVKMLDEPFCLDDCLVIPSYEGVEKMLFSSGDDDDEDDDETPSKDEDDEDGDDDDDDDEETDKDDDDDDDELSGKDEEKPGKKDDQKCPYGHKYGKDTDKKENADDCDECKKYNACNKVKKGKK